MKRATLIIVFVSVVVFLFFFFLAPVVGHTWVNCGGYGYASLSYHFFGFGEVYYSGVEGGPYYGQPIYVMHSFFWLSSPAPPLACF
jgi:hypothetical protein